MWANVVLLCRVLNEGRLSLGICTGGVELMPKCWCAACFPDWESGLMADGLTLSSFVAMRHGQKPIVMDLTERIQRSETRIFKAVFPNTTNHYDTLFGGTAMHLMDEVAFITATRFSRKRMVTVSSDRINFTKPIPAGTIIELIGTVSEVGNTSLKVLVEIYIEEMYSFDREKAITGTFTFVAIDEHKHPIRVVE